MKHSYSAIKDFQQCPRRFHQVRILRKFKSMPTEATMYGERVHKAFEDYIMGRAGLPLEFEKFTKFVDPLKAFEGEILCEQKLGICRDFSPCDFYDENVWFRGIPDFLCVNREKGTARIGDFKTGKSSRFADSAQLELMAALVMQHYPEVRTVKGALIFVVANDIIQSKYTRDMLPVILSKWAGEADLVETAQVWNPKPSGLCGFCPVSPDACEYKRA